MMNYPGVIAGEPEVLEKINLAHKYGKPVDGHAPGLSGTQLKQYIKAGISTDHEAFELNEALTKIEAGMKILIREGSAAKNFDALHSLIDTHPGQVMFCSDDKHPDALLEGHLNRIVKRALSLGHNLFKVLQCASMNPVRHYQLDVGMLQIGDPADFIIVDNFDNFRVLKTYINGVKIAEAGHCLLSRIPGEIVNHFRSQPKKASDFEVRSNRTQVKVIEAVTDQLITKYRVMKAKKSGDLIVISDKGKKYLLDNLEEIMAVEV
jgi:adenine deaminase